MNIANLKNKYKTIVSTTVYFACGLLIVFGFIIDKFSLLPKGNPDSILETAILGIFVLFGCVLTFMACLCISASFSSVYLKLKEDTPLTLSFLAIMSGKFPESWMIDANDRDTSKKSQAKVLITIVAINFLTAFFIARYGDSIVEPVNNYFYVPPLDRGEECLNSSSPVNVNMKFDRITAIDSLNLLAGFSCNEFKYKNVSEEIIQLNYLDEPWEDVVREICKRQNLKCMTEDGVLYALGK
jgi:hypothetical protein